MPTPFETMLFYLSEIAKEKHNQTPFCPTCGEGVCIIKHGFYLRYLFCGFEMIAIQRYGCGNPFCHRITFSNLPHPFLPFIRLPLCVLEAMLKMVQDYKMTTAAVARSCKMGWRRVYRVLHTARRLFGWIKIEANLNQLVKNHLWNKRRPSRSSLYRYIRQHNLKRDPYLKPDRAPRPFEFVHFGQLWTADFMHGPRLWVNKRKRKT